MTTEQKKGNDIMVMVYVAVLFYFGYKALK